MQGETINPGASGSGNINGPTTTSGESSAQVSEATLYLYLSSIEKSQQSSKEHERDPAIPYLPLLQFPLSNVPMTPDDFQKIMLDAQEKCVNAFCDQWVKAEAEKAAQFRQNVADKIRLGLDRLVNVAIGGTTEGDKVAFVATATALFMVIATSLAQVGSITAISGSEIPGLATIKDLVTSSINLNLIPSDMRAELGLIGAVFASVLFYPAISGALATTGIADEKTFNLAFAKKYAKQVSKLVESPEFENFALVVLFKGKAVDPAEAKTLLATMKLVMLFTALALVYRVETGHVIGDDVKGMMDGITKLPEGDPRLEIVEHIKQLLGLLPGNGEMLKELFYKYFDSTPTVEHLLEPSRLVKGAVEIHDYERIGSTPVD